MLQIAKAEAANGFHWTKRQGCHINANNFIRKLLYYIVTRKIDDKED
jgi:hypothetical protein